MDKDFKVPHFFVHLFIFFKTNIICISHFKCFISACLHAFPGHYFIRHFSKPSQFIVILLVLSHVMRCNEKNVPEECNVIQSLFFLAVSMWFKNISSWTCKMVLSSLFLKTAIWTEILVFPVKCKMIQIFVLDNCKLILWCLFF